MVQAHFIIGCQWRIRPDDLKKGFIENALIQKAGKNNGILCIIKVMRSIRGYDDHFVFLDGILVSLKEKGAGA